MSSIQPETQIEKMLPIRQPHDRGMSRGAPVINLLRGNTFWRQALEKSDTDITKALVNALLLPGGQRFADSEPSFTLKRTSSKYPRLFAVSSLRNRGSPTSERLAEIAAEYLSGCIANKIPTSDPLFLRVVDRTNDEYAAILGGFVAIGADLVPQVLLGGKICSPPLRVDFSEIPFSQMNK